MRYCEFKSVIFNLFENQAQYKQMLNGLVKHNIIDSSKAENIVKSLRINLKRNDRIVWWINWYRIAQAHRYTKKRLLNADDTVKDQALQVFNEITKKDYNQISEYDVNYFLLRWSTMFMIEHLNYQITNIPAIAQMVWNINESPQNIMEELEFYETEYNRRQSEEVDLEEGDKIILDYGNYAWVMLNRGACDAEGRAMGHCGNVPSVRDGDRIISFRSKLKNNKQKPHLTFILDKYGFLGEMKGRANTKPKEKYHTYIVDLLKQNNIIKGIKGGGYAPEENFELDDLDDNTRKELVKSNPVLGNIKDLIDLNVDRKIIVQKVLYVLASEGHYKHYDPTRETIYIGEYDSVSEIGSAMNDNDLENVGSYDVFDGGKTSYDHYFDGLNKNMVEEILKNMHGRLRNSLINYLKKSHNYDPDEHDLAEFILDSSDSDVFAAFESGAAEGTAVGTESEMYNDVIDHLNSQGFQRIEDLELIKNDLKKSLKYPSRSNWVLSITINEVILYAKNKNFNDQELIEDFDNDIPEVIGYVKLSIPNYGWDGWNIEAAVERTEDELSGLF
jgi:hypothetical protein